MPAKAQTPNPGSGLVPDARPDAVVVCSYSGHFIVTGPKADTISQTALSGTRALHGDLSSVTSDLASTPRGTPRACLQNLASTDGQYYLIGLAFHGRTDWVSVPGNHCKGTTNGVFMGKSNLRADAAQAYQYGTWVSDPAVVKRCDVSPDATSPATMPAGRASLTICAGPDLIRFALTVTQSTIRPTRNTSTTT